MTTKLNLTPLIKYFSQSNPEIANRLKTVVAADPNFESGFLGSDLKSRVDNVTAADFMEVKTLLAKFINESPKFSKLAKAKHLVEVTKLPSPKKLQFFFYNYILKAEGGGVISHRSSSENKSLAKIAQALIEVADELDRTDPDLAKEADSILQDLIKNAQEVGGAWESIDHGLMGGGDDSRGPKKGPFAPMLEDADPDIQDPVEPEPEFDEVSLEDLENRANGMNWLSDRSRRDRFHQALEHGRRAKDYLDAHNKHRDKAHSVFDEAGDKLRFKF